jgi:hypothetical protein
MILCLMNLFFLVPCLLWLVWFLLSSPIETKIIVKIGIGPGCELGLHVSQECFYWCPFGFVSAEFRVV